LHGIEYYETFAPIVKMDSIHLELTIVTTKGWEVYQMDVNNSFLHGDLSKEIYMEHPQGFMKDSYLVCPLKKSLYGPKKAPMEWYAKMEFYLLSQKFVCCKSDLNVYMLRMIDSLLLLVMYVDDLLIIGCWTSLIVAIKRILHYRFLMIDMGPLHFFLGLKINQDASGIKLSQAKYAQDLLEIFHMKNYKSFPTPFLSRVRLEEGRETPLVENTLYIQLVGILLYLTHSRPNLSYEVGVISRFMQELHELHWKDENCILRYIQSIITFGIQYKIDSTLDLIEFIDSDWDGDNIDRRSTSSYSVSIGYGHICWLSKKKDDISLY
jgi:hypothetical protein